jgi:hypothetical protein
MSDLGFDPRGYCERLAKACPDRFTEVTVTVLTSHSMTSRSTYENVWQVVDSTRPNMPVRLNLDWTLWAFFGPLADERKIQPSALFETCATFWAHGSALESIIASVVESFEQEKVSTNG